MRRVYFAAALLFLALFVISGCAAGAATSQQEASHPPASQLQGQGAVVNKCQGRDLATSATIQSPLATRQTLYFAGSSNLYAISASNGAMRWCNHVSLTQRFNCPMGEHCPPPPFAIFGTPTVVDDVVYVCASGGESDVTYAFSASNGALRWSTNTDCWIVDMPFGDNAAPIVSNGAVYSGTYALRARDGKKLWKVSYNVQQDGAFSLQALVRGVIYANTEDYVYAVNASNGSILWRFAPQNRMPIGGPLVVAATTVYVGTLSSVEQPDASMFYALNAENGALRWQYHMGDYTGAALANDVIYVSSRGQYLYALNLTNGALYWRHQFNGPVYNAASVVNTTLYLNGDGAYALSAQSGAVLWHQLLGANQSMSFIPSTVVDGVDYLASIDGEGNSILYALNAANGEQYWHVSGFPQVSTLTVA